MCVCAAAVNVGLNSDTLNVGLHVGFPRFFVGFASSVFIGTPVVVARPPIAVIAGPVVVVAARWGC